MIRNAHLATNRKGAWLRHGYLSGGRHKVAVDALADWEGCRKDSRMAMSLEGDTDYGRRPG